MGNSSFRTVASFFISILIGAVLIGVYSDYFKVPHRSGLVIYLNAILLALLIILFYGYWLFAIPAVFLFHVIAPGLSTLAPHVKGRIRDVFYIGLGLVIGTVYSIPVLFMTRGVPRRIAWDEVLACSLVGAAYETLYRYWIAGEKPRLDGASDR